MQKKRILIADDEPIIRMDLQEILESHGYGVVDASDGEMALELLRTQEFDLAILDINMPKLSGLDVVKKLDKSKEFPIIFLTAYSQTHTVEEAIGMGILGYLVKPVREEQLFPSIQLALNHFSSLKNFKDQEIQLKEKFQEKELIRKAVAFLQDKYGMEEKSAYGRMRKYSMEKRLTLDEIAKEILKNSK